MLGIVVKLIILGLLLIWIDFLKWISMDRKEIRKLVRDMDEETELAFLEEIVKKRVARLKREE